MSEVRKYRSNLVSREDLGLWEGDIAPILDEAEEVDLHWKGGKIPARILWECLAWFRKVNEKYSSEAQARLGYNPTTKEWCWVAYPQYVVAGLYSKEIPSDELTDEQRAMRLRATKEMADGGFMEAGTIHSHCDAGAFASGTDDKDEISQNGVHITLGEISSGHPEIHGRVVFRKIKYPIHSPLSRFLRGSRWREIYEKPGRRGVRLGGLLFGGRPVMQRMAVIRNSSRKLAT